MGRRQALVFAVVLGLVGSACADEADSASPELRSVIDAAGESTEDEAVEDDALDAALEQMVDLGNEGFAEDLTDEEERCIDEHPDLRDIDFRAAAADSDAVEERVALARVLIDCIERAEIFAPLVTNGLRTASIELQLAESTCLVEAVLEDANDPARLLVVGDSTADLQMLASAMEECLTPEHYAQITLQPGAGPQAYGDDDRLDSMYDDCTEGEMRACDLLWVQVSEGSEYEEHAATCGGTEEDTGAFCSAEAEMNDTGFAPPDSPGLDVLAADCEEDDLTACDLLYRLVPAGHRLENVGFTCGGRIAVGAVPDCRTRFG